MGKGINLNEGFIDDFRAECLAERFIKKATPFSTAKIVHSMPNSSRRGARIKNHDRQFKNKLVIGRDVTKKTYRCVTLESDPEKKNTLLLVEHVLSLNPEDVFEDNIKRVIARFSFHFIVRLIQRSSMYRGENELSIEDFKDIIEVIERSIEHFTAAMFHRGMVLTNVPQESKYILVNLYHAVCPVELSPCPFGSSFKGAPVPVINFKTYIELESCSEKVIKGVDSYFEFIAINGEFARREVMFHSYISFKMSARIRLLSSIKEGVRKQESSIDVYETLKESVLKTFSNLSSRRSFVDIEGVIRLMSDLIPVNDCVELKCISRSNVYEEGIENPTKEQLFVEFITLALCYHFDDGFKESVAAGTLEE